MPNEVKLTRLKHEDTYKKIGLLLGLTEQTCSKLENNPDLYTIGQVKILKKHWGLDKEQCWNIFFNE